MRKRQTVDIEQVDTDDALADPAAVPSSSTSGRGASSLRQPSTSRGVSCGVVAALLLLVATLFLVLSGLGYFVMSAHHDRVELGTMRERARSDAAALDSTKHHVAVLEARVESLQSQLIAFESANALLESKLEHISEGRTEARAQLALCQEQLRLEIATARSLGAGGRPVHSQQQQQSEGQQQSVLRRTNGESLLEPSGLGRDVLQCTVNVTGDYEADFRAEHAQDKFVLAYFLPQKTHGTFVEFGAGDGITASNSYFFEKHLCWTGICIEPR